MRASAVVLSLFIVLSEHVFGKINNWLKLDNKIKGYPSAGKNRLTSFDKFGQQFEALKKYSKLNLRSKWASYLNKDVKNLPQWQKGTVPYHIDIKSYDDIIVRRIEESMKEIEHASCVLFTKTSYKARRRFGVWLHITNPENERECVHNTRTIKRQVVVLTLGFDCMQKRDIIHALLHALGFQDEVTHPQRESFVRIIWENIQPKYRPLFAIQKESTPYQMLADYDTTSIMHFHDRAFSINGGPTVIPMLPGLQINPSNGLSQLDTMKLRLLFGQACNKRNFDDLVQTCKKSMVGSENNHDYSKHDSSKALNGEDSNDETGQSKERIEESKLKDDESENDNFKETGSEDDKFESGKSESDFKPQINKLNEATNDKTNKDTVPEEPKDDVNPQDESNPQNDPDVGFKASIEIEIDIEAEEKSKKNPSGTKTSKKEDTKKPPPDESKVTKRFTKPPKKLKPRFQHPILKCTNC